MGRLLLRSLLVIILAAIALAVVAFAATWAPDVSVDELKAKWAPPPSTFVDVNGMQVHLRDEGPREDPVPIVLIHGTSSSLHTWDGWTNELKAKRRVIRFDLPGFGLTGPNRQDDYSIATYVLFVRTVVDQLGIGRFVIGGNSLGGMVAWSVAAAMPDRVAALILVDAGGYPPQTYINERDMPIGFRIAGTPGLRWMAQYTLPRGVVERSVRNVYGDPSKVTPELVDRYAAMTLREGNRHALGRRFEQGFTADVSKIKTIKAPTLILWGGKDRLIPPVVGEWFERDIAGSKRIVFPELGHVPQEEDPARTVAEVKRFLAS